MTEELKVIITAEINKLKQGTQEAEKQILTFKQQVAKAGKEVEDKFKAMGTSIKNTASKIGLGIAAVGTALIANVAATEEYRNQQAQLITAFETAGASAETAKETYNDLYRVLGDGGQAQEAAQHLAKLTTNEKDLTQWTNICQGVYATFGASLPIESLTEAANETAKTGSLTGALADALNWAGVSEDAFQEKLDACNTEAEREQLIRETLNGLYSDAAAKYEVNNAQILAQRDAQAALQEKLAALGEALAPVLTLFTNLANEALAFVIPYVQQLAEQYLPLLEGVLKTVGEALAAAFTWISQHKEVLAVMAGIIAGVVAAIGLYNAVAAIKTAMDAAQVASIGGLIAAHAAQAVAALAAIAPYLLIVAAIAAVIAIIVLCVKYWDEIKAAAAAAWEWIKKAWQNAGVWFKGIVDKIKAAFAAIGEWFSNLFKKAWLGIQNAWSGVKNWFSNLWKGIQTVFNAVGSWFSTLFKNAWNGIKNAWSSVKSWFSGIWNGIKAAFASVGSWFGSIFTTAWNNIKKAFSSITGFFTGIWNSIKSIFSNVGTAIANGIKGAVSTAVNKVLSVACKIINGFIGAINFAIDIINAIPGVNISRLNTLSVPAMAKGGIVDSATLAMIGEDGKEAVMPLENNLGWLDKLAGMLNDRMGGGNTPIILQVDGKTFAQTSIDSINQLTKQTGQLALNIV